MWRRAWRDKILPALMNFRCGCARLVVAFLRPASLFSFFCCCASGMQTSFHQSLARVHRPAEEVTSRGPTQSTLPGVPLLTTCRTPRSVFPALFSPVFVGFGLVWAGIYKPPIHPCIQARPHPGVCGL